MTQIIMMNQDFKIIFYHKQPVKGDFIDILKASASAANKKVKKKTKKKKGNG
ncbi:MAG: hypothetical protein ACLQQ4_18820 [Bacteroidia bacterium]